MSEYFNFCHREEDDKNYAIGQSNKKIDEKTAIIEDNTAQIAALDEELIQLGTEMAKLGSAQEEKEELRKESKEEFKKREKEQEIMVEELQRLETELEKQMEAMTTPPPVELLQDATSFVETGVSHHEQKPAASFWAEQAVQAKTDIQNRKRAEIRRHRALAANAQFRQAFNQHATEMMRRLDFRGVPVEALKRMERGLAQTLLYLETDPMASKQQGMFIQADPGNVEMGAEQLNAIQDTNAKNLETFKALKEKAEKALQNERDIESENQHQYMLDKQARQQEMNICEDKTDKAKEDRANFQEEKAEAEGELAEAEKTKAADMKYLETLLAECESASKAWDERKQSAADEQAAIGKAQEILQSRVKVFFLQSGMTNHMVQPLISSQIASEKKDERIRQTLLTHFRSLGSKLHSLSLLNMANAVAADPLAKVKGLITDLIKKLEEEAAEAADTHAFCEEESKKNAKAKKTAEDKLTKVKIRLDKANARLAELADQVTSLTQDMAEINAADQEATEMRNEEKKTFEKNHADFKEAEAAVIEAMEVLKDFYGPDAFIQVGMSVDTTTKSPIAVQPPAMGGAKSDSAGGILAIMDTMASEFAKTVAELESTEREAQKAYDKLIQDNKVSKATKEAEVKGMESEIEMLKVSAGEHQDDIAFNQEELDAVLAYIEKLKPTCVGTVMPYEERKAKREAEIEGLKDALQILDETGDTLKMVSFLQIRKTL